MLAGMSQAHHMGDKSGTKSVVSYVRRSPRMNPSQRNALARLSSRYLVDVPHGELSTSVAVHAHVDWAAQFGRPVDELLVEIGSGTGDALVASALLIRRPAWSPSRSRESRGGTMAVGHRGRPMPGVDGGWRRVWNVDRARLVRELSTFFPDPWHKKRHHKRRLVLFGELVASRLVVGGSLAAGHRLA